MNIDIKSILATGERVTLECKKAQHSVPNSLWDTYSAFANTYGGTILLGVVEHTEEKDNAWNEKHWLRPELVEQPELMQVKLTLYFENDPVNDPVKLTDRQNMILQMFDEDNTLSRERLCEKTSLSEGTIKREIAYLKSIGKLKRIGSDKTGYWLVEK